MRKKPSQNGHDVGDLLRRVTKACRRAGHPVDDPECGSAVGWGVHLALEAHDGRPGLFTFARRLALRECRQWAEEARKAREKLEEALPLIHHLQARPDHATPLPEAELELLRFVARHGASRAARLLRVRFYRLQEILAGIRRRAQKGY